MRRNLLVYNSMRRFERRIALPTVMLVAGLAACSDSTGGGTPTSEISPVFNISAAPNSITFVFGKLAAESFTSVRLSDDDALVATAAGQVKQLHWTVDPVGSGLYAASLSQLEPGTLINIALTRGDGGDAPNSQVIMPASLTVTAPVPNISVLAGQNILVAWSPSGTAEEMQVVMRADLCDRPGAGNIVVTTLVGDSGSATVPVDPSLLPPLASGEDCDVEVQVQRVATGTVDPAYAGGSIQARQLDGVTIRVEQP